MWVGISLLQYVFRISDSTQQIMFAHYHISPPSALYFLLGIELKNTFEIISIHFSFMTWMQQYFL